MNESLTNEQLLIALAAAPKRIHELTQALSAEALHTAPGPDEWSASDLLAHLRACADVWGKYIAVILAEDRPAFRAMSPRTWAKRTDYAAHEFHASLAAYNLQRDQLLIVLGGLSAPDWDRHATVTHGAKVKLNTVSIYAHMLVNHEQAHIQQLEHIVSKTHAR